MPLIKFSLTAACLSVLFLGAVVANAVLAPMPTKIVSWTTVVTTDCPRCLDLPQFDQAGHLREAARAATR